MLPPIGGGDETGISFPFRMAHGIGHVLENSLTDGCDDDETVRGGGWRVQNPFRRIRKLRQLAFINQQANDRVHQRHIDELADTIAFLTQESGLNGAEGKNRGHYIRRVYAACFRPGQFILILQLRQVQAATRMDHRRIGGLHGARTGLAKAGYGAIDQIRMIRHQRRIIKAQALHHAGAKILHYDIGTGNQFPGRR